ncbi:rRNA-processing protein EBP2, putative [Babesia caballi]|uniref:rRNA-processing protein EBP2, putative n=1 Tax=Babesia caballi TaxID=5871 RepID=A0AAV4LWU0_BABCB|nr:rRNA-processing protein EBP2, putative [Babesia caballi]
MPLQIKALGYVLKPGERFADSDDLPDGHEEDSSADEAVEKVAPVYKEAEILDKIKEIVARRDGKELPWIETLTVTSDQLCRQDFDRNETLKIEDHFKEIASGCVKRGLQQLASLGIDFNRPPDFYADMVKTDFQMARVMKKLANRSKAIQEKKSKHSMKVKRGFDKQVKQRQSKNKFIKEVNKIAKRRGGDVPVEKQVDRLIESHTRGEAKRNSAAGSAKVGTRRERANLREAKKQAAKQKVRKSKQKGSAKPPGKVGRRGKGDKRGKGGNRGKAKGRK